MILTSEKIVAYELCPRRYAWTNIYYTRVSLIRALYLSLDAGLRTEKDPEKTAENEFLALAASPGLDVTGHDVYTIAMHYAKLAGILAAALRSAWSEPWKLVEPVEMGDHEWQSGAYRTRDGVIRRLAMVDRWSDDRKQQELSGWRTIGEVCALNEPIMLTAISIGASHDKRRHSDWTRCYRHPRNRTFRMRRRNTDEDFSETWHKVWREDSGISTTSWMKQMREDGSMEELVHTIRVPVSQSREAYLAEMARIAREMESLPEVPPMRLAGCYGFSPCPFLGVCPEIHPEKRGFQVQAALENASLLSRKNTC